jgi:hypothetical protein
MEWASNICFRKSFSNSKVRTNWKQIQFSGDWMQCEAFLRLDNTCHILSFTIYLYTHKMFDDIINVA